MTRARTQLIIMVIYLVFGALALATPGIVFDVLGISSGDRTPIANLMTRAFGATCVGIALALFFLIANALGGKQLMRALAGLEGAVIVAVVLSLGADDIGLRAGLLVAILSGALGLFNLYGGFLAPIKLEKSTEAG
jgi:hypothetical protein